MDSPASCTALQLCGGLRLLAVVLIGAIPAAALAQKNAPLPPVRAGDEVEYKWVDSWQPAVVEEYHDTGHATLRYKWGNTETTRRFPLNEIRFPRDEGHWMHWGDASGKFRIEARFIRRDETNVTLRKADGSEVTVPIERLSKPLQTELAKYAKAIQKLRTESPLREGDEIEVHNYWTWYPGKVVKILPGGAQVAFNDGWKDTQREFKHEEMRYPNGEGPWREWADTTGKHKIIARYLTHDDTHVELLKEDKTKVRLEREKLAAKLQQELKAAVMFTRRPPEVEFQLAGDEGKTTSSWMDFGKGIPAFSHDLLSVETVAPPQFEEGGFEFAIGKASKLSLIEPIGGDSQLLAIGVHEPSSSATTPTTLYWASLKARKAVAGPHFFPDEIILGYSAEHQRLITAEVRGTWRTPVRFCSYRLALGGKSAKPELKWSVPKSSFAAASTATEVAFLDNDRVLVGYGGSVGLWNLLDRRMEYVIPSSNNEMHLSPDKKYFGTNQFSRAVIVETDTGKPIAHYGGISHLAFSRDGKYLVTASHWGISAQDLHSQSDAITFGTQAYLLGKNDFNFSVVAEGWFSNGSQLWHLPRQMLAWRYVGAHDQLNLAYSTALNDKLLAVGTRGKDVQTSVLIGVAKIPHAAPLNAMNTVTEEELYVLRPGAKVRLDSTLQDARMTSGIQRAIQSAQWILDPSSEIVIKASSGPGEPVTNTYEFSRFGFGAGKGDYQQTITITPWVQLIEIFQGERRLWATRQGGVPPMVMLRENQSLQEELAPAAAASYSLFDGFEFPQRLLAPKYENGLGNSLITPSGLVDQPVDANLVAPAPAAE